MTEPQLTIIELNSEPIALYQLLKLSNFVGGGGEAKLAITQGYVLVNGEVELQKRKKIFAGDMVEFNGQLVVMELMAEDDITDEPSNSEDVFAQATDANQNPQSNTRPKIRDAELKSTKVKKVKKEQSKPPASVNKPKNSNRKNAPSSKSPAPHKTQQPQKVEVDARKKRKPISF